MPLGAHKAALFGIAGASSVSVELLETQTATDATGVAFTAKINAVYSEYIFAFYDINPATDGATFQFQCDTAAGANGYDDLDICSSHPRSILTSNTVGAVEHLDAGAQGGTSNYQDLGSHTGSASNECITGELHLVNPQGLTYQTHFWAHMQDHNEATTKATQDFVGGYFMDIPGSQVINAINFRFDSGNFDGKIKMWGMKT